MARRRFRLSGGPRSLAVVCVLLAILPIALFVPTPARAFGEVGAFDPRVLIIGSSTGAARPTAPARWSWELVQRTSAPARLKPSVVRAVDPELVDAPFAYLSGERALDPLTSNEISGLRKFFALGGVLFIDDAAAGEDGAASAFGTSARREIRRVLPDSLAVDLPATHVVHRSYYLLRRPEGRVLGAKTLQAVVRGGTAQVIFGAHDLGGALARSPGGFWEHAVVPGGDAQRERAVRLAVNIAMYVLCSNYKDDQVHAPFIMRRRAIRSTSEP